MGLSTLYEFPFGLGANPWRTAARINAETVCLLTRRAHAYLDLSRGLGGCLTTEDFMTQQVAFWQVAQRQYMESLQTAAFAVLPIASIDEGYDSPAARVRSRDYIVVSETASPAVVASKDAVASKQIQPEQLRKSA